MELPSKYSSKGLSIADQKRVITTGAPRVNRPIGALKIEERVNDILDQRQAQSIVHPKKYDDEDSDGDIQMFGMDNEEEVQVIADYVHESRQNSTRASPSFENPDFEFDDDNDEDDDESDIPNQPVSKPSRSSILVLDTNFIISHLDIIDKLAKLHTTYHHTIVIPNTVIRELDGLKGSQRTANDLIDGTTVGHLARWANDWIYKKLADSHSSVRGQKLREVIDRNAVKDDAILDCCLYFQQHEKALVVLLSNDKNLCMKALTNEVLTVSYRKNMNAQTIARKVFEENQSASPSYHQPLLEITSPIQQEPIIEDTDIDLDPIVIDPPTVPQTQTQTQTQTPESTPSTKPPQASTNNLLIKVSGFEQASKLIHSEVQQLVLGSVDYCMYQEYDDDLDMVGYDKSEVTTLWDASNTMIRFWVSVFTEYFQNSHTKPFNTKGRKTPVFFRPPLDDTELFEFLTYWKDVLRALYLKRDEVQNNALEKVIERWEYIANSFDS